MSNVFIWGPLLALAGLVAFFLIRNGKRNNDPLNRKAAAEICAYLTSPNSNFTPQAIAEILYRNARYRTQAKHIASMVPVLLDNAGMPWEAAKKYQQIVLQAAEMLPE